MDKKSNYGVALFISVLLHSLLVFFPWKEEPRPSAETSTPTRSISVVELPILPASESQSLPAVPSSPPSPVVPPSPPSLVVPPSPPAPAVPPSPPVATPVDPPINLPPEDPSTETSDISTEGTAPSAAPSADLPPEIPSTETSDSPTEEPTPSADLPPEDSSIETSDSPTEEPTPSADLPPEDPSTETSDSPIDEAKIAADWENLVGHLQSQNQGFDSLPLLDIFNFFGEPEQTKQFFDENNQLKLDVSSFYLFPEQTPEQVLRTVVIPELTSNTGFDLQPQDNVSAGLAYQLSQGEMLRYLIIVQLNERSGSVLMLSNSLLGLES